MSDFKGRHFEGKIVLWGGVVAGPYRLTLGE